MTKSERWILSEWQVACHRVRHFNERLVAHREKTPFAEVDLLFAGREALTLIEVKTWSGDIWADHLISCRQRLRIARARCYLEDRHARPVRMLLAAVSRTGGCDLLPGLRYFDLGEARDGY